MYYTWVTLIFIIWVLSLKVESQSWYSNPCSGHVLTPSIVTVERSGLGHYLLNKINRLGHIFIIFFFACVIIWPPTSNISLRNLFSWYVFTWAQNSLYIIDNSKNYLDNLSTHWFLWLCFFVSHLFEWLLFICGQWFSFWLFIISSGGSWFMYLINQGEKKPLNENINNRVTTPPPPPNKKKNYRN